MRGRGRSAGRIERFGTAAGSDTNCRSGKQHLRRRPGFRDNLVRVYHHNGFRFDASVHVFIDDSRGRRARSGAIRRG